MPSPLDILVYFFFFVLSVFFSCELYLSQVVPKGPKKQTKYCDCIFNCKVQHAYRISNEMNIGRRHNHLNTEHYKNT